MAWTSPKTFAANAVLTAAELNTHLRDNLNETAVAKSTTAGQYPVATAANALAMRMAATANNITSDTTTSTSYGDLASTAGPSVTVTTGTMALVTVGARIACSAAGNFAYMSFEVSGATTRAASNDESINIRQNNGSTELVRASAVTLVTGLTPGSNTFKSVYRVSGPATGTYESRNIIVQPY